MLSQTLSLVEKTSSLERSSHYFFASESAIENALFHKNSRGTGWESKDNSENSNNFINHEAINAISKWTISARSNSFSGELYPSTNIEIPFYWDESNTGSPEEIIETDIDDIDFSITFEAIENLKKIVASDRPIIDWDLSRTSGEELQKFIPDRSCEKSGKTEKSTTICTDDLRYDLDVNGFILQISKSINLNGKISPGNIDTTLNKFLTEGSPSHFKFSFRPLFPLQKKDSSDTIHYISPAKFEFENNNSINSKNPQQFYTINSSVTLPDFIQDLSIKVAEKTSIGVFNYSILGE
jgi:hypothetical protein